jgi:hypothetical protein
MDSNHNPTPDSGTPPKTPTAKYLAFGVNLNFCMSGDQWDVFKYLATQPDHFATNCCDGNLRSIGITRGYLLITVDCEDPYQALSSLLSFLERHELNYSDNTSEGPVFLYAQYGQDSEPEIISKLINQAYIEGCAGDAYLDAMLEGQELMTKLTGS